MPERQALSVLALSSRFDGHPSLETPSDTSSLSVLALSSRFDGHRYVGGGGGGGTCFQYSLCRVVLMVHYLCLAALTENQLSVLALSSRFDGPYTF